MKLRKLCEKVRDSNPGTDEHDEACLAVAEYLGVSIYIGQYVGDKADEDFALIILRALEGREGDEEDAAENYVSPRNKLLHSTELKVKN